MRNRCGAGHASTGPAPSCYALGMPAGRKMPLTVISSIPRCRACRERPRSRRAREQRDELAQYCSTSTIGALKYWLIMFFACHRWIMYGRRPRSKRNLTISEAFGCGHVFGL